MLFCFILLAMCGRISQKDYRNCGPFIEGWLNPEGEFDERPGRNIKTTKPAYMSQGGGDGLIKTLEARG